MRNIYLLRHAHPAYPEGESRCISATDYTLDDYGTYQAQVLGAYFSEFPVRYIYTSPLKRCRQTATGLLPHSRMFRVDGRLREVAAGDWENLTFSEIRKSYPDEYERRGVHLGTAAPPGGESFAQAGARMEAALLDILSGTKGDLIVVSHSGAIRGLLLRLSGKDPDAVRSINQPWGCINHLTFDDGDLSGTSVSASFVPRNHPASDDADWPRAGGAVIGAAQRLHIVSTGGKPGKYPEEAECAFFFRILHTPEAIIRHGYAVRDCALELSECAAEVSVDRGLLSAACLLHDIGRGGGRKRDHIATDAAVKNKDHAATDAAFKSQDHVTTGAALKNEDHAATGAAFLVGEGYPETARCIAHHHDLGEAASVEAELLYLADKLVSGTKRVTLEERFAASRAKCKDAEGVANWERRLRDAKLVASRYRLEAFI